MTTLTADELTTLAEVLGHEPSIALVEWVEETIGVHRDQAAVMVAIGGSAAECQSCGCNLDANGDCWWCK